MTVSDIHKTVASPLDLIKDVKDAKKVTDFKIPTVKEIYDAVPPHCRVRDPWTSFAYLVRDLTFIYTNHSLSCFLIPLFCGSSWLLSFIAWTIFAFTQGTLMTGVWVIGHECGHGAFSAIPILNDCVGFVTHILLLVPYFSWQYTHAKHHKFTNHLSKGETHVPPTRKQFSSGFTLAQAVSEQMFEAYEVVIHLVFGWPMYLIYNASGGSETWNEEKLIRAKGRVNHFFGRNSQLFPPQERFKVTASGIACLLIMLCLAILSVSYGFLPVMKLYIGPYLVTNGWLVLYTWLHHSHEDCPHYDDDTFTWLRGALSTIDRPFNPLINYLHHEIGSTHVLHHLDHTIPHYHAVEASEAIQKVLGPLYRYDERSIVEAVCGCSRKCHFVEDREGVRFYRSVYDKFNAKSIAAEKKLDDTSVGTTLEVDNKCDAKKIATENKPEESSDKPCT